MQSNDRKLAWAAFLLFAVIALEFGWFLFIGPVSAAHGAQVYRPWWWTSEFWTAAFTGLLTLSTALLWWQTKRLAEGAEDQSKKMVESLKEMRRSAKAATKAAEVAERTLVAQDRPWIHIQPNIVGPLIFTETEISIEINVTLRNVGRSPATDVQLMSEMCVSLVDASRKADEYIQQKWSRLLSFGSMLFPNTEINLPFNGGYTYSITTKNFVDKIVESEKGRLASEPEGEPWNFGSPALLFAVAYGVPADQGPWRKQTVMCFEIAHSAPGHWGWDGHACEIPAEKLILRHYFGGKTT